MYTEQEFRYMMGQEAESHKPSRIQQCVAEITKRLQSIVSATSWTTNEAQHRQALADLVVVERQVRAIRKEVNKRK